MSSTLSSWLKRPYHGPMRIVRLAPGDERVVLAGADLFDAPPTEAWTAKFLSSEGHHVLVAVDGEHPIGSVTGVETTHPDKGTEMFLYELSVHPHHRNRGVGRALVGALADLARGRGCYGMWVAIPSPTTPPRSPPIALRAPRLPSHL